MSGFVKEIGHRQVYDILQSRKPAGEAGFGGGASDFTKLFRRVYGVSPSDMRAALLNEKDIRST